MTTTRKEVKVGAKTYRKIGGRIEVLVYTAYGASSYWKVVVKPSTSTLAAFA